MEHITRVQVSESVEQFQREAQDLVPTGELCAQPSEAPGVGVGQPEEGGTIARLTVIVQRDDVGVGEPSRDAYLELEELAEAYVGSQLWANDLQSYRSVEDHVARPQHSPHTALTEQGIGL